MVTTICLTVILLSFGFLILSSCIVRFIKNQKTILFFYKLALVSGALMALGVLALYAFFSSHQPPVNI